MVENWITGCMRLCLEIRKGVSYWVHKDTVEAYCVLLCKTFVICQQQYNIHSIDMHLNLHRWLYRSSSQVFMYSASLQVLSYTVGMLSRKHAVIIVILTSPPFEYSLIHNIMPKSPLLLGVLWACNTSKPVSRLPGACWGCSRPKKAARLDFCQLQSLCYDTLPHGGREVQKWCNTGSRSNHKVKTYYFGRKNDLISITHSISNFNFQKYPCIILHRC